MSTILDTESATRYVIAHFAKSGEHVKVLDYDLSEPDMIQVEFRTYDENHRLTNEGCFAVWECSCAEHDGTPHLYGEY